MGFHPWFVSYTFPSRLPNLVRLAEPDRPVVVRAAPTLSHPLPHLRDRAALSFTNQLRQVDGGSFHPTWSYGASWRT
jgi:hypothetical protein